MFNMQCGWLLTHPCTWAQEKQQTEDWRNLYNKKLQKVFYSSQHCKVKLSLITVHIHTREWRYSSTHSQHKTEMGGELHAPTAIFLVPIVIKAGWAPQLVWKLQRGYKCLAKVGIKPRFLSCPAHGLVTILTALTWLPS
jgi:hypothetical protein